MLREDVPILRADQIAHALDRAEEVFDVPEWGGPVKLKAWSLEQRDMVMALATDTGRVDGKVDAQKLVRLLVVYGVVEPTLTEADIKDKAFPVVDRIAQAVMRINGMAKEATLTAAATFDRNPDLLFQFQLAKDLGMTVGQLRRNLTSWELQFWAEFYDRERKAIEDARR